MEHFVDQSQLRDKMSSRIIEQGIFNTSENSVVMNLIEAMLVPLDDLNALGEDIQRDMFATTATGSSLDRHGQLQGLARSTGTVPFGTLRIYISDGLTASAVTTDQNGIKIPIGTRVFGAKHPFKTAEDGYINSTESETTVRVVGTEIIDSPIPSNTLAVLDIDYDEDFDNLSSFTMGTAIINCTNDTELTSGSQYESDSDYRNRLYYRNRSYHDTMIDNIMALAYDVPEVADITFVNNTHGIGTTTLVVTAKNPITSTGIIDAVASAISDIGNDSIFVMSPEYLGVQIFNKVVYDADLDADAIRTIQSNISTMQRDAINNIKNGGTLSISQLEIIATNTSPAVLKSTVTCIKINNRTVTLDDQKAGWDEKFVTLDQNQEPSIKFV